MDQLLVSAYAGMRMGRLRAGVVIVEVAVVLAYLVGGVVAGLGVVLLIEYLYG